MKVRTVIEWEIDPVKWVAAAANEREIYDDEIDPADYETVATQATRYCDAEDLLPRWARSAMQVVEQEIKIAGLLAIAERMEED
jgi:isopentenyldiphosphate isomerase